MLKNEPKRRIMKKTLKKGVIAMMVIRGVVGNVDGQDIHYTQWEHIRLWQNSAYVGSGVSGSYKVGLMHRSQWGNVMSRGYETSGLVGELRLEGGDRGYWGIGLLVNQDVAGYSTYRQTNVELLMGYHLKVGERSWLSAGLNSGLWMHRLDETKLQFGNQYDANGYNSGISSGESVSAGGRTMGEVGGGVSYRWMDESRERGIERNDNSGLSVEIGGSMRHINRMGYSLTGEGSRLGIRTNVQLMIHYGLAEGKIGLRPGIWYMGQQGSRENMIGMDVRYFVKEGDGSGKLSGMALSGGLWYRMGDALSPVIQLEIGSIRVHMSYDINNSDLRQVSRGRGGFEIGLVYQGSNPFGGKAQSRFD